MIHLGSLTTQLTNCRTNVCQREVLLSIGQTELYGKFNTNI